MTELNDNSQDKNNKNLSDEDKTQTYLASSKESKLEAHHPKKIGQYIIKRVIASGGMGTVFEALQENPKRPVAIKVIKQNITDEGAIQRLEYEAQMLARLRHPGIAQIYEAGSFDDNGHQIPFFAMEYIPNAKTIQKYAFDNHLNTKSKIELFLQVCDAVHHGHQRGIVHRDLKPSNLLVDSSGRVRVIDFGVARATDADMKQAEGLTNYGQIVGTVQYMSPEQFDADPHDIDIRSDVYALGFILYELLSGQLPYSTSSVNIFDFASEVRTGKTIPISSRDSSLKGDIEAIILKALNRDRKNRYQSAFGLAQDLRRYITGDAVIATKPGIGYQVKIFARKNKLIIGLLGSAFVLLLISVVVTSFLLVKVEQEKKTAEIAKQNAKEGQQFLSDVLTATFPWGYGDKVTVIDILERASSRLDEAFPDDPEIEGEIRHSLGLAFAKMGHYDQAEEEIERALKLFTNSFGLSNDKTLQTLYLMGNIYNILEKKSDKLRIRKTIVEALTTKYGATDIRTLEYKEAVATTLEELDEISKALEIEKEIWGQYKSILGEDSSNTLWAQTQYSWLLLKSNDIDHAEELAKDVLQKSMNLGGDAHDILRDAKSCLSAIYISEAKIDEAIQVYSDKKIPESFGIDTVFQGDLNLDRKPFQMLIFFETWCPFSRIAMKRLGKVDNQYSNLGLDIVGFTQVTKNAVNGDVPPYLKELNIEFPIMKENGRSWNYFECEGTPSIRLLYNGFLIWEKRWFTPDIITNQMLEGIVEAQACGAFR